MHWDTCEGFLFWRTRRRYVWRRPMDDGCLPFTLELKDRARLLEVELRRVELERVVRFFDMLLDWNARTNLTGAKSREELLADHWLDSVALIRLLPSHAEVIDVGSGGGLPAFPFALMRPDCRIRMIEPRSKRVAFLRHATRSLGLENAVVIESRLQKGRSGPLFSSMALSDVALPCCAISRATFSVGEWMEFGAEVAGVGGSVVVFDTQRSPGIARLQPLEELSYQTGRGSLRVTSLLQVRH